MPSRLIKIKIPEKDLSEFEKLLSEATQNFQTKEGYNGLNWKAKRKKYGRMCIYNVM